MLKISGNCKQRNIMEYQYFRLIIWRSLVQAQAGPLKNQAVTKFRNCFFFVCVNKLFECLLFHIRKVRLGGDELFVADVHVEDDSGSARFCGFQNPVFFCGIVCVEADEHIHYV